jgi:hypothetical protein
MAAACFGPITLRDVAALALLAGMNASAGATAKRTTARIATSVLADSIALAGYGQEQGLKMLKNACVMMRDAMMRLDDDSHEAQAYLLVHVGTYMY